MNLWPFTKPAAQPLRAIVATRSESLAAWFAAQLTYATETRRGR